MAYVEQVGVKRQVGGSKGEIRYWYALINQMKVLFMGRPLFMEDSLWAVSCRKTAGSYCLIDVSR